MSSLKEIKERISSVKSTLKITSAMKLVSSAKLHKTAQRIAPLQLYENEIFRSLKEVGAMSAFSGQKEGTTIVVAFSSNTSLCGGFNANMTKLALSVLQSEQDAKLYCVGRRVAEALGRAGYKAEKTFHSLIDKPEYDSSDALADELINAYLNGECSKVVLVYSKYLSTSRQEPVTETYLPLVIPSDTSVIPSEAEGSILERYIVEPGLEELRRDLTDKYLRINIYSAVLNTSLSQHAARMIAMQTASDNGENILADLTLEYNKSRQAKITAEILDLAGGSQQE